MTRARARDACVRTNQLCLNRRASTRVGVAMGRHASSRTGSLESICERVFSGPDEGPDVIAPSGAATTMTGHRHSTRTPGLLGPLKSSAELSGGPGDATETYFTSHRPMRGKKGPAASVSKKRARMSLGDVQRGPGERERERKKTTRKRDRKKRTIRRWSAKGADGPKNALAL